MLHHWTVVFCILCVHICFAYLHLNSHKQEATLATYNLLLCIGECNDWWNSENCDKLATFSAGKLWLLNKTSVTKRFHGFTDWLNLCQFLRLRDCNIVNSWRDCRWCNIKSMKYKTGEFSQIKTEEITNRGCIQ